MKLKYKNFSKKIFIASSFAVLASCVNKVNSTDSSKWGYVGAEGPEHWGNCQQIISNVIMVNNNHL